MNAAVRGATILTRSGVYFDLAAPVPEMVHVDDIAHALSRLCRFTGHTLPFYSVAQHSVLVSRLVAPPFALEALLHDAHEAYVGDVSSPLKALLPEYREIERRVEQVVRTRFGLPREMSPQVKGADLAALATEQRDVMRNADAWPVLAGVKPQPGEIVAYGCATAKRWFLQRFAELGGV